MAQSGKDWLPNGNGEKKNSSQNLTILPEIRRPGEFSGKNEVH